SILQRKVTFCVLPAAGRRNGNDGISYSLANEGDYWSSSLTVAGQSPRLAFTDGVANMNTTTFANALSVRCVQVFTAALLILYFQKLITLLYH
ncbi:hypothetical protein DW095_14540, partial [Bacteroides sp. AM07-16]|uniref:fibrobacter succinogenes major paralogous domain-containing protein n=1 Tax=Parabacteroides bouchesdurhonensis TaxID=1936995 RepID=UPI000FF5632A